LSVIGKVLAIGEFPVARSYNRSTVAAAACAHVAVVEFDAPKHFPARRVVLELAVVHALYTLDLIEASTQGTGSTTTRAHSVLGR
jgi:hypothetical protein